MNNFDAGKIREYTKTLVPKADFDSTYTFYYDETNNIRKFYVREFDFNSTLTNNFVLGGLVHEGSAPNVQHLIDSFKLQNTINEVKFKHIAKGNFIDCLKSYKVNLFLTFIKNSNLYIHYSILNVLYWSIVDIVDSAIMSSKASQELGQQFSNRLKNDLYKLSMIEIDSIIRLFYKFGFPNIKKDDVSQFIKELIDIFGEYLNDPVFHFGLESLRQILKEANKKNSLPFIMGGEDLILIDNFLIFYLRPIYLFKNSTHIFDNEDVITDLLKDYKISDGISEIKNYSFVDSKTNQLTQLSDIVVGLISKLLLFLKSSTKYEIYNTFSLLTSIQGKNIDLLLDLIEKSHKKNIGFLHAIDSDEERIKIEYLHQVRRNISPIIVA